VAAVAIEKLFWNPMSSDAVVATFEDAELGPFAGDRGALDRLFAATYEELRRLAAIVRQGDAAATLTPTALVHEAWLKLADSLSIAPTSRLHFKRIAARAMRQVLIEAARKRRADKRGGAAAMVTFDEDAGYPATTADELLLLHSALDDLARVNARQALMIESRFFGGLDVAETAQLLKVSEATVLRDWRAAKAWLSSELHGG
jgi:RNA polymerase sigma factor (TIGR02999 family)